MQWRALLTAALSSVRSHFLSLLGFPTTRSQSWVSQNGRNGKYSVGLNYPMMITQNKLFNATIHLEGFSAAELVKP